MEFSSLEEITEYFGIATADINEARKELKQMLSKLHPDRTGGSYQNKKQQKDYEEISSAIEFIDGTNTDVAITNKEWKEVLQTIQDLKIYKNRNDLITEDEVIKQLNTSITTSVINFSKKHLSYKISSVVIAGIITSLWGFPSIIEGHKILKRLINPESLWFSLFWLGSIAICVVTWLYTKNLERKDELIKKKYALESTQNAIFKLFLAWFHCIFPSAVKFEKFENDDHKHVYYFTKDDLINFLLHYYEKLFDEFQSEIVNSDFDLYQAIYNAYDKDRKRIQSIAKEKKKTYLFKNPGEIDFDLAQKIADTIVSKLVSRNIVTVGKNKTLSETVIYIES